MAGSCLGLLSAVMRANRSVLRMTLLRICLVCAWSLLLWGAALGQSEREALITAFSSEMKALNTGDLNAAVATVHEKIVLYGLYSPFPIEGKEAFRQAVQEYFDEQEHAVLEIVHPRYRMTGTTGVAWGHYQLTRKLKGEPVDMTPGQYMLTYVQVDGVWLVISMHFAPLPR